MFGRAICDKLPEFIFENFEIARVKSKAREISKFPKIKGAIYPQICSNQTCDYSLITPNQQILYINTNIF